MKNKKSMGSVFLFMFLRTVVIILFLVIVAMGVLLGMQIRQAKKNKKATEARKAVSQNGSADEKQVDELLTADGSTGETVDDGQNTEEQPVTAQDKPDDGTDYDLSLAVLNGTYAEGLAGAWVERLTAKGYTNLHAGDYSDYTSQTTVYIMDENVTTGLTAVFPDAVFIYGSPEAEYVGMDLSGLQAVLVVGESDNIVNGGE